MDNLNPSCSGSTL